MSKKKDETDQYQHFVSKFLLKNFTDNAGKTHTYKCENGKWTEHNICNTGGDNLYYGPKDCSLEKFFSKLENIIAIAVNKHNGIDKNDTAYLKIFIPLMAHRSPSKRKITTEKYNDFVKGRSNKDVYTNYSEHRKKEIERYLLSLEDDPVIREIVNTFSTDFKDSGNLKFYPVATKELLQIMPKLGNSFKIAVFESDYDLVIGESPTLSVNLTTNEVKTNGEEAGLLNKNVMYWLPAAYNKAVFMYTADTIVVNGDRKLRKQDVDVLNYFQKRKSPFFYSRKQDVEIPELSNGFNWLRDFNYVFGYKNKIIQESIPLGKKETNP
jgi:hypothetical protein